MSLNLDQLSTQIREFRGPIVTPKGEMTNEFKQLFYQVTNESKDVVDTAQTAANTAQTAADSAAASAASAANSSGYMEFPNGKATTWADVGSGYPAGDPTRDLTATCRDKDGTQVATMVVRGALTSATGLIALSVQSESATTDYSIDEVFTGSGTASARATITVTFPDSSVVVGVLAWNSSDQSAAFENLLFA